MKGVNDLKLCSKIVRHIYNCYINLLHLFNKSNKIIYIVYLSIYFTALKGPLSPLYFITTPHFEVLFCALPKGHTMLGQLGPSSQTQLE